jgi:hypothetical protein
MEINAEKIDVLVTEEGQKIAKELFEKYFLA